MSSFEANPAVEAEVGLKREIGLVSAVNFLINYIIGAGIFITPGKVLAGSGSVGMMLTVWTLCGFISFLTCLPFGELSTVVPKSGSVYIYLQSAFSHFHPFYGNLPAFIYFWVQYMIIYPCSTALQVILLADYSYVILKYFEAADFFVCESAVKAMVGTLLLVSIGVINCVSVRLQIRSQDILTFSKMAAILFTIACGMYMFASGDGNELDPGFEGSKSSITELAQAMLFGLYAFDGGWAITGITEELKNPERNITLSIVIALTITTVAYLLLNLTFLSALSKDEITSGCTVISDFAVKLFGPIGGVVAAVVISLCLITSIMCSIFYSSRMGYVAAREGHVVRLLCSVHRSRRTPVPAVVVQVLLSLAYFLVGGNITVLIDMCAFFMWLSYGGAMLALFTLRYKLPQAFRPLRVPSLIPAVVTVVSFSLVVDSLVFTDVHLILVFILFISCLIILDYIFVYRQVSFVSVDKMQTNFQNMLNLVIPEGSVSSKKG